MSCVRLYLASGPTGDPLWIPGLPAAIEDGKASECTYTADGDRLARKQDGKTTLYLPGGQEVTVDGDVVIGQRYYTFNGETVAARFRNHLCGHREAADIETLDEGWHQCCLGCGGIDRRR